MERRAGRRGMTATVCMAPRILMFPSGGGVYLYTKENRRITDNRTSRINVSLNLTGFELIKNKRCL